MRAKLRFNTAALETAAAQARHLRRNGRLHLAAISRHADIDRSVLSRVTRHENGPDLATVFQLAKAYRMPIEDLVVEDAPGEAAA